MRIITYWDTPTEIMAIDDKSVMHFIEKKKISDYLDRNNFLDWHMNIKDDIETAMIRGKLTFDEWLHESERCSLDIACYLESQRIIANILNPINNILKCFKNED